MTMTSGQYKIGLYPGTFDPITNGHVDIIQRAAGQVDKLIVAIAANERKRPLFTLAERQTMLQGEIARLSCADKIEVRVFSNLLMHFAEDVKANVIIRGLRAVSDFEYEFQMAGMNARLNPDIQTIFLMASDRHQFISSRFVKEIAALNGDVTAFVSRPVADYLIGKFGANDRRAVNA